MTHMLTRGLSCTKKGKKKKERAKHKMNLNLGKLGVTMPKQTPPARGRVGYNSKKLCRWPRREKKKKAIRGEQKIASCGKKKRERPSVNAL